MLTNLFASAQEDILEAANSVKKFTSTRKIPKNLLNTSQALVIIPTYMKASFFLGAQYGEGVAVVRRENQTWSNPFFIKITGGSLGLQFGLESNDTMLLFRNAKALKELLDGKITLGTELSLSIGALEENYNKYKEGNFQSDVLVYHMKNGLFVGASLDGTVLTHDDEKNSVIYAGEKNVQEIVQQGLLQDIYAIKELHKNLDNYK